MSSLPPRGDEQALVERAKRDPNAFGELYDRYVLQMYRFVYSRVRDQTVAEDVTQEVFMKALKSAGRMNAYRDPEMDDLGDEQGWDPQVRELAHYLRASARAYAHIEPSVRFRQDLRRRLMREAWELAARPPKPWYQRLLAPQ